MPNLICYDIRNNSLRTKVGNKILDAGFDRVNLSVYLGNPDKSSLKILENWIHQIIMEKGEPTDSVIILDVHSAQIHTMRIFGKNDLDPGEITGDKSTLIL